MRKTFILMSIITLFLCSVFILWGVSFHDEFIIFKRLIRLGTIALASICLAVSTVIFQTLTHNRILVPAVMGYESFYLLWQVLVLFLFGPVSITFLGLTGNFLSSILLLLIYAFILHYVLLPIFKNDTYFSLLFGFILSMVLATLAQFFQLWMSPGEFTIFQSLTNTSFNRSNLDILIYSSIILLPILILLQRCLSILDVLSLGKNQSISLGINYAKYKALFLILIAILVAISTSLVGITLFMGIFIANIAYLIIKNGKHKDILPVATMVSVMVFLIAQLVVEHFFNYRITVSILVNLVCGIYYLFFIIFARKI
ncbi:iron chelate uptake ABC transporter family permease subunit [Pelistega sp. NLN82]|uniref:Iron chelate uptake ABC transporter family permease subunit n=1 Tax=Pelistega ratti TaxID=2652177 RepID=A0A6L9Y5V4_9BURK|nr:iron chelate uptake ABC transporter family permease subunit [Pelistega ratti]NEN75307.1 iron chelate uptake ABC transporter family permease subunit [Pelistega ratti]